MKEKKTFTKNEHYIPQFLLELFKNDKGNLYYLNKDSLNIGICSTENACSKTDTYEIKKDFGKGEEYLLRNEIEDSLSQRENDYSLLCQKIISICDNPKNCAALIVQERELLIEFIVSLHLRNPDRLRYYINALYSKQRDVNLFQEVECLKKLYPDEIITKILETSIEFCLSQRTLLSNKNGLLDFYKQQLLQMGSFCFFKSSNSNFVISDNAASVSKDGFVFIPINPRYIIAVSLSKEFRKTHQQNRLFRIDNETEQDINKCILQEAKKYVYGRKSSLEILKYCNYANNVTSTRNQNMSDLYNEPSDEKWDMPEG